MKFYLVIMAAGMGKRFGGMKQVSEVGASGETLMEYAIFDGLRAGFDEVIFVIRKDIEEYFRAGILKRMEEAGIKYHLVYQEIAEGRAKPYGTGEATLKVVEAVKGDRYAVINADDFYGRRALIQLYEGLASLKAGEHCMVGYRVGETLSEEGGVSRGYCNVGGDSHLVDIEELREVKRREDGKITEQLGRVLAEDSIVSMNFWGFSHEIEEVLKDEFANFLKKDDGTTEFNLPYAVNEMVHAKQGKVKVQVSEDQWYGMTYATDRQKVKDMLSDKVASGEYPKYLWSNTVV